MRNTINNSKTTMTDELKKLEGILGIQFEEHGYQKEQPNAYRAYNGRISELYITGQNFDLSVLFPLKEELYQLRLTNCTIDNLEGLSQLPLLSEIHFDNVTILKGEKAMNPLFESMPDMDPRIHVYLENMHLEFPAELLYSKKRLDHLFLTNCTISNFYEINLLPELYDLRLTNVIIRQTEEDIMHPALPERGFIRICLDEMHLENLDVLLPISENVTHIRLECCTIGSIRNIHQFKMLDLFEIDSETQIGDKEFEINPCADFYIETCKIGSVLGYEPVPEEFFSFDLQQLGSIAHYVKSFHLQGTMLSNTKCLKHFPQLEEMKFEKCTAQLNDFLPVARQIKALSFDEAEVTHWECIHSFTQLENIKTSTFHEVQMVGDFNVLLPVKHQLKVLELYEENIQNLELISEFKALEFLELSGLESAEAAKNVLTLSSLKKLNWSFFLEDELEKPEEPVIFDISGLKSIRELELWSDHISVTGIEQLTELVGLKLRCGCEIEKLHLLKNLEYLEIKSGKENNVNTISTMESLKTLVLSVEENHLVHSLEQFPNLEKLQLDGRSRNVIPGKLEKLKILVPSQIELENAAWLSDLPNLERLKLQYQEIASIQNLDQLTNLKMLDLSENKLKSLKGIENLQKLEYLNLYGNNLRNVRVLDQLPNLKEVNLAGNALEDEVLREQLDRPEIARFVYRPYVPFNVSIDRDYDDDDES